VFRPQPIQLELRMALQKLPRTNPDSHRAIPSTPASIRRDDSSRDEAGLALFPLERVIGSPMALVPDAYEPGIGNRPASRSVQGS
jgi:hypothetical protein